MRSRTGVSTTDRLGQFSGDKLLLLHEIVEVGPERRHGRELASDGADFVERRVEFVRFGEKTLECLVRVEIMEWRQSLQLKWSNEGCGCKDVPS